ncbi:DUF6515 family protein [Ferruginibacter yonginensis]|uniref:DUF6515 family protein n=1 Tax=Ferruginibacter yonginensis TaxID=1310416 RepID=A0ABV8QR11_9BACT
MMQTTYINSKYLTKPLMVLLLMSISTMPLFAQRNFNRSQKSDNNTFKRNNTPSNDASNKRFAYKRYNENTATNRNGNNAAAINNNSRLNNNNANRFNNYRRSNNSSINNTVVNNNTSNSFYRGNSRRVVINNTTVNVYNSPGNYARYNLPVYRAGNPNWRYGYLPRRNTYYSSLPANYVSINFGGGIFRYYNGIYYRPYNNYFTVIAPPIGIRIRVLPIGYRRIYVRNYPYYYFNGTYYDYDQPANEYAVVAPPVGAIVESLPDGFETVTIDGETYYTADGAQYKPVVQDNGEIWYEVIKTN